MSGETNIKKLIKEMNPVLQKGQFVFCTVKDINIINRKDTICEFKEKEGTTVVIELKKADELKLEYNFIASWITLNIHSSLDAVGLTAIFSNQLAKNNISCNVISGYYHDHIFVNQNDSERAIRVLKKLSKNHN